MNWLRGFMQGRRGPDPLTLALLVVYWPFSFLGRLPGFRFCSVLALVLLAVAVYRIFSKDLIRRERENRLFLNYWRRLRAWLGSLSPGNIRQKSLLFSPAGAPVKGRAPHQKQRRPLGTVPVGRKTPDTNIFPVLFAAKACGSPGFREKSWSPAPNAAGNLTKNFDSQMF